MAQKMEVAQYQQFTPALAAALTQITGDQWQAAGYTFTADGDPRSYTSQMPHDCTHLERADGLGLWLSQQYPLPADRIKVRYNLTDDERRQYSSYSGIDIPEITCALARGVEVIAKEISRRLLPACEISKAKLQERVQSHNKYVGGVQSNLAVVQAALGDQADPHANLHRDPERPIAELRYTSGGPYGTFTPGSDGISKIELNSVPVDLACQIAALCAEYRRKLTNTID